MPRDKREYITVHNGMPDHPKVDGLSDAAFRLLVRVWCRCSAYKTDGAIDPKWWAKQKPAARRELLAEGLVEAAIIGDGVIVHDYDQHQITTKDMAERTAATSSAGKKGAHERWHVAQGKPSPDCPLCREDSKSIAGAIRER